MSGDLTARIRASFDRQGLMATFGASLDDVAPGAVTISAPITPGVQQQQGYAHAGLTFALGDTAAGYSALSLLPEDREVVTAEIKVNLLAPATGERIVARGRVLKPGRRLVVVQSEVFAQDGGGAETPVAILLGTMVPVAA
jgi:uncharacterized protein (TIGR00369 family)